MPTYSKIPLSQSSNGSTILLATSAAPGTLLHTTQTNNTDLDEVWLYANNVGIIDSLVTVYWGNTATANSIGTFAIAAYAGPTILSPGLVLRGDGATGGVVYATSSVISGVSVAGYINRITA